MGINALNTYDFALNSSHILNRNNDAPTSTLSVEEPKEILFEEDTVELSNQAQKLLNPEEKEIEQEAEKLEERDSQVRQHEQAHKSVGGSYAGPIVYEYKTGSDGKRYATGGHVDFYMSKEATPQATIHKAETIYRAAMAPGDPSSADLQVARSAQKMKQEAQVELREEQGQRTDNAMQDASNSPEPRVLNASNIL